MSELDNSPALNGFFDLVDVSLTTTCGASDGVQAWAAELQKQTQMSRSRLKELRTDLILVTMALHSLTMEQSTVAVDKWLCVPAVADR